MEQCRGAQLAQEISRFSPMSMAEARAVQHRIFANGPASRAEAENIFMACNVFEAGDAAWKVAVVETICDSALGQGEEYGHLEFDGEDWLIDWLSDDSVSDEGLRFDILQAVLDRAENATMRLGRFGLFAALKAGKMYDVLHAPAIPAQEAATA